MSPAFAPYTTFKPGELEQALQQIATAEAGAAAAAAALSNASFPARPGRLLKEHACAVSYPDGRDGACRYERLGPAYHRFVFTHADGTPLARQWWTRPLENSVKAIEHKAGELAPLAFATAIERERKEYFCRASESHERKKQPERYQMTAERARHVAGKYALCRPLGEAGQALVPVTAAFTSLDVVNALWRQTGDPRLVVACGNRLDRCWERPRYNPLYGEYPDLDPNRAGLDPRPRGPAAPKDAP